MAGGEGARGERSVGPPANVGSAAGSIKSVAADKAEVKKNAGKSGEPEAEGIEAGKSHIARANHQGHEVVRKSKEHGHGDEENHRGAVHSEHLIEKLRRNEIVVRTDKLDAQNHGLNAADYEEDQGVEDIKDAEALVVYGGDPVVEGLNPGTGGNSASRNGQCIRCHDSASKKFTLAQRFQIIHKRIEIRVAEFHGRHQRAGLERVGILNPKS